MTFKLSYINFHIAVVLLWITGCQTPSKMPGPSAFCPGKITVEEAASALAEQRARLVPLRVSTRAEVQLRDSENKVRRESVDGRVWFIPPDRMLFTGDKFGKEISFGANEREFWLRIKPELDTYWYGTCAQSQACSHVLPMNPANLVEAIGMVEVDRRWELFHRDGFDWLTLRKGSRPIKRVYVDACDYRVVRIEYFDPRGRLSAATDLTGYKDVGEGLMLPAKICLTTFLGGQEDSSAEFELRQVRPFEPTEKQLQNLFERPGRDDYGTVLRLGEHCNFVRE